MGRTQDLGHIRTSRPVNNIYVFAYISLGPGDGCGASLFSDKLPCSGPRDAVGVAPLSGGLLLMLPGPGDAGSGQPVSDGLLLTLPGPRDAGRGPPFSDCFHLTLSGLGDAESRPPWGKDEN